MSRINIWGWGGGNYGAQKLRFFCELPERNYLPLVGADLHILAVIKPIGGEYPWRFRSLSVGGERKGRKREGGLVFEIYQYWSWSQCSPLESSPCRLFVNNPVSKDYEAHFVREGCLRGFGKASLLVDGQMGFKAPIYLIPMLFYYTMLSMTHLTGFLYKILEIPIVRAIHLCMHSFIYSVVLGRFKTLRFGKSEILALPHSTECRNCFLPRRIRTQFFIMERHWSGNQKT